MGALIPLNYQIDWRDTAEGLIPYYQSVGGEWERAAWAPQYGSQWAFLSSTPVFEVLYEGGRGNGKTDCLLMDFLQHVGKGYGEEWRGILFRRTYKQLSDVVVKTRKWFPRIFPGAVFNQQDYRWTFPSGEMLFLRYMDKEEDYWNYHGHAYPWIGWEELCNWSSDKCYKAMMSCCRSTKIGMPRCYRSTANPYGPGHNWVKSRFRLPHSRGQVIRGTADEPPRVAIHGHLRENRVLLRADPDYLTKIRAAARNPSELAAWVDGSWDITAGGMFDDLWDGRIHVVKAFPLALTPRRWKIDRGFDWGSTSPFSVLWFLESNGEGFEYQGRTYGPVPGDVFIGAEWYGWNGTRNEGIRLPAVDIADGIKDRESDWGIRQRVRPGPADSAIWTDENENCVATDMESRGVRWTRAYKGPGSRVNGWEQVRRYLKGSIPIPGCPREVSGLYVFDTCTQFIETFPCCPRLDSNLDDVDSKSEDHAADTARYRLSKRVKRTRQGSMHAAA